MMCVVYNNLSKLLIIVFTGLFISIHFFMDILHNLIHIIIKKTKFYYIKIYLHSLFSSTTLAIYIEY